MMLRALSVSLLFAVLAVPAYAQDSDPVPTSQDNPETRQTDQSEDDYRRSQRRRDVGDIFEDIGINTGSSGSGNRSLGREIKAIDRLDQESRRHLNKQRAKALAEAKPGEPIDAAYEPSDAAKTDEYVARQEEAAWEEMMREANSGLSGTQGQGTSQGTDQGGSQGGQQGQGQSGQQGQAGSQSGQGQPDGSQGQAGQGQSGQGQSGQSASSPLRGGSASSASAILDRIKGRTGSGSPTASPSGQSPSGQSPSSQSSPGQSPLGSGQQGQAQAEAQAAAQAAAEAQAMADAASQAAAQAQAEAQSQATQAAQDSAQAAAEAAATAQAQADASAQAAQAAQDAADAEAAAKAQAASDVNAAAEAAAHHDAPMSPLERLKRDPIDRGETGTRTSASDYLKRGN